MELSMVSMIQTSDLLPYYSIVEESENRYCFTTDGGSKYELLFIQYDIFPDIPEGCLYVFNIERTARGGVDTDPDMIRHTAKLGSGPNLGLAYFFNTLFKSLTEGGIC